MVLEGNTVGESNRERTELFMLALAALERATAELRFIEENAISISEFRELFPAIWDDMNKATYYLNSLNNSSTKTVTFLHN
jgi:hypothetical protein